ncbi:hypothetical protein BZB76_2817 [Actinomadura pelletieri DSM 43383]|uniref:Uncharacterized protein n=1 Tax=Actinomadura pelletieri DSM 43383 TaxID=1120940 RepID=A0A495QN00_9ACTN|nr:DUF6461 domain-containing protein [Actinomadura pelletieri]RKS74306.1 hypothetical protein BZB76_2817 [Actinomadura pelletieri DSM 43383]
MLNVTPGDIEWVDGDERLGEIFCLTFVKDVDETEALTRLGALPDTLGPRDLEEAAEAYDRFETGYEESAFALNLGDWTMVVEVNGFQGGLVEQLAGLSRGTEAVSVQRHDYADHGFRYAVDGTLVTGFEPTWPRYRWGSEPDRLLGKMRAAGLDPDAGDEDEDEYEDEDGSVSAAYVPAFLLAGLVTGAVPHPDALTGRLLSAEIEPWFGAASPSLSAGPTDPAMIAALDAAPPRLLRAVAAAEVMRLATVLGLDATPGLAEAVAAAERGETVTVSAGSELGAHVRSWLARARQANRSLNDPTARSRMSGDERTAAYMGAWFADALRGALWPEPHAAARAALHPLTQGPDPLRDPAREKAVLHTLRRAQDPA